MTVNHGVPGSSPGGGARKQKEISAFFVFEMFVVYIIYSEKLNRFYIGTTDDFQRRLAEHNSTHYENSFTSRGIPWEEYLVIDRMTSEQARKVEAHIKKMRSSTYLKNLKNYPELAEKLKEKYKV